MVIDTSAILALMRNEPERDRVVAVLKAASKRYISAVSLFEIHIVMHKYKSLTIIDELQVALEKIGAIIVPFDEYQARRAEVAYRRYGKGQGHKAQLNFGDCAVYAAAKSLNEPILCVGNDFLHTDIQLC
jgi:ribonuclease VapC